MHGLGRTVSQLPKVEAFEDVEYLNQCDSTRGWWRSPNYLISAIGAADGLALLDLIVGKVFGRDQSAALLQGRGQFPRQGAVVEIVRFFGNALQGAG